MDVLNQAQVEAEILRLSNLAERATTALAKRARVAAEADADYKCAHAKAFLEADGTVGEREARAALATQVQYRDRKIAEALLMGAQEAGRNYRAQLDALRSIAANLRALVVN
jgi:hypothetical protein